MQFTGEYIMNYHAFYTGHVFDAYRFLGCHYSPESTTFTVFAPAAQRVCLTGACNGWTETDLNRIHNGQFWQLTLPHIPEGMLYKYRIYHGNGSFTDHCDPYGFGMELRPAFASIVSDLDRYQFHDDAWMHTRTDCRRSPLNIYELHLGSWKRNASETGFMNYREIAHALVPYLKKYHYTHAELMPLAEHPSDNSWGYQCTGFFSPTSRYGSLDDLKYFVDYCHQNGIGVIMDYVPVHFAVDGYALANFDGSPLYEYPNQDIGHSEWGSPNFNHSRCEVQCFLQSCAYYWLKEYHFDGLRMDAISNIIYWQGNEQRGINTNAADWLRNMNRVLKEAFPTAMLIAEDSSSFSGVTAPADQGGLGFDYKWDMGWMNDTLNFFRTDPLYRGRDYHKLTFSMMYYYNENYLLPLSHDEVVHGKATIIQKMSGDYPVKFPQARALYMYMLTHPGKKLNFMGNEIAMFREWDEKREPDWDLLTYPLHEAFTRYIEELNNTYSAHPALYYADYEKDGFFWNNCHEEPRVLYAYERRGGGERIITVLNLSGLKANHFRFPVEHARSLRLLLDSDDPRWGGSGVFSPGRSCIIENNMADVSCAAFSAQMYLVC